MRVVVVLKTKKKKRLLKTFSLELQPSRSLDFVSSGSTTLDQRQHAKFYKRSCVGNLHGRNHRYHGNQHLKKLLTNLLHFKLTTFHN